MKRLQAILLKTKNKLSLLKKKRAGCRFWEKPFKDLKKRRFSKQSLDLREE
jgi:hypothetical protein